MPDIIEKYYLELAVDSVGDRRELLWEEVKAVFGEDVANRMFHNNEGPFASLVPK